MNERWIKLNRVKFLSVKSFYLLQIMFGILVFNLTACGSDQNTSTSIATISPTPIPSPMISVLAVPSTINAQNISSTILVTVGPTPTLSIVASVLAVSPAVTATHSITSVPTPTISIQPTITLVKSDRLLERYTRWLKGIPCRPPCWEGVTPGRTTADEAVKIWQQSQFMCNVRISPSDKSHGTISWDGGLGAGEAYFYPDSINPSNGTIYTIRPHIGPFMLSQIIEAYGEPSHVGTNSVSYDGKTISYRVWIYYQALGFSLGNEFGSKPTIDSDLSLDNVNFFELNLMPVILSPPSEVVTVWKGFQDFYFYCNKKP